jgi:hypothetical protein
VKPFGRAVFQAFLIMVSWFDRLHCVVFFHRIGVVGSVHCLDLPSG